MESGRSKKVRSRRTPVANLASFAPRESGFLQTGIDGVPQRHAPRPSRQSACASRNRTFFAPRHPAIASPFPHSSADPPPGYPRPGKHTGAHPSARGKGPSSTPVSAPHVGTPLFASILPTSEEASSAPLPPTTSQPVAQRYVSKAALSSRAFASHPLPSH